jgi:molecular chaperone DnaK
VSGTSNLDSSEVDRMLADAERNREEDSRVRTLVDARNELEAGAYRVERRLSELGDAGPEHERARAAMLVADARQAIKEEAPLDRVRSLTGEVQQVYQGLMTYQPPSPDGPDPGPSGQGPAGKSGGDVIDADFTER